MRKDLDLDHLIYYSNKLYNYIKTKFTGVDNKINTLESKVDSDKQELQDNIDTANQAIAQNTSDIQAANTNIAACDTKVDNIKTELDTKPIYPITNVNNIEQFVFKNVKMNDVVEIPNTNKATNYLIECYTQIDAGVEVEVVSIDVNPANKDKFIYDSNYVDIDNDGAKPKDTILLKFNKSQVTYNSQTVNIFESEVIPDEIVSRIESVVSIDEQVGVI